MLSSMAVVFLPPGQAFGHWLLYVVVLFVCKTLTLIFYILFFFRVTGYGCSILRLCFQVFVRLLYFTFYLQMLDVVSYSSLVAFKSFSTLSSLTSLCVECFYRPFWKHADLNRSLKRSFPLFYFMSLMTWFT